MAEKELRKLRRHELLQLLLDHVKETEELQEALEQTQEQLRLEQESVERLKARLESKDVKIQRLKGRLDRKDEQIHELRTLMGHQQATRKIQLEQAGSIAEAALQLNGIFEQAQKIADQYLYNVGLLCGEEPDEEDAQGYDEEIEAILADDSPDPEDIELQKLLEEDAAETEKALAEAQSVTAEAGRILAGAEQAAAAATG